MSERVVIGDCTLYRGDCREVLPGLGAADLCLTDPPYGMSYIGNATSETISSPITMDGMRVSLRLYRTIIPMIAHMPTLWFTRWDVWPDVWELFAAQTKLNGLLVWEKAGKGLGGLGTGNPKHWAPTYELIASAGGIRLRGTRESSILRFPRVPAARRTHPTEKPLALLEHLIAQASDPGQTILDLFLGTGSCAEAAIKTGRRFVGVEIDTRNFDLACRRVEMAYRQGNLLAEAA